MELRNILVSRNLSTCIGDLFFFGAYYSFVFAMPLEQVRSKADSD